MSLQQLKKLAAHKRSLAIQHQQYPLSCSRLWVPYCCRWDGFGSSSKRKQGCGQPMQRKHHNIWHCSTCNIMEKRTSQTDPLIFGLGSEATLIAGGNRSGKSSLAFQLGIATAAGAKVWWVQEWIKLNGLPADIVQEDPAVVWFSALSYSDALEYIRCGLDKYLPSNTKKIRWNSQDRASAILENGGRITSMSADAGRAKYQGSSVKMVILDEEHPEDIMQECQLRTADQNGCVVLTMTPLKGLSWVYSAFVEPPEEPDGYRVHYLSGLDNPWVSSRKLRSTVQHMSPASQQSRLFGRFGSQEGLVYPEFDPIMHIIEPITIPDHWLRMRSIDFGVSHPFCCLWFALERDNGRDCLHVYREHYRKNLTTLDNGKIIKELSKDEQYEWTVCDPESKDGRMTLARELKIYNTPAAKHIGVIETINWTKERLALDQEGYPRLVVHKCCKNLIKEFRLYSWKKNAKIDAPEKKFDHALDALRYQITTLKRYNMHQ